jgi:ferric-dicitrate binding protein FerR (iron transport regulator)
LTSGSQIQYAADKKNQIILSGNATFMVHSKEDEQFLVQAGETWIKDVGTIFTVAASNPNEEIEVKVKQGEVLFYTFTDKGIHIKENETGVYNPKTKQFSFLRRQKETDSVSKENVTALDTKNASDELSVAAADDVKTEINFKKVYLYQAVDKLKTHYGVDIVFEDHSLRLMQITASFDNHETIDHVLQIIAETLSIHISRRDENTFVIAE